MGTRVHIALAAFVVAAGGGLLTGCGTAARDARGGAGHHPAKAVAALPAPDGYALLSDATGVTGVPLDGSGSTRWDGAVAAPDRSTVVRTRAGATHTLVTATRPGTA